MNAAVPLAAVGFALGWPMEWVICRFPRASSSAASLSRQLAVGALTAVLFAALALRLGPHARLLPALVLTAILIAAAAIDLRHRIIPNAVNVPGAAAAFACAALAEPSRAGELLLAGAGAFGGFLALWAVSRRGIGLGDVKMVGVAGLGLGSGVVPALLIASLGSGVVALGLLVAGGSKARRTAIPFGPFIALGAVAALLLS